MPLFVDLGELAERLRAHLSRWIDASLVERARADCTPQLVEGDVRIRLGADFPVRPLLQAHARVTETRPPRVLASITRPPFVFTQFVESHQSPFLSLRYSLVHGTALSLAPVLDLARMPFKPGIDPLRLQTNGPSSADACMPELAALARRVNRVTAHARVIRPFRYRQPVLH